MSLIRHYFVTLLSFFFLVSGLDVYAVHYSSSAPSVILMNADTEVVLFQKNAHKLVYPASTTKIATALYSLHLKGSRYLNDSVTVKPEALKTVTEKKKIQAKYKLPGWWLESDGAFAGLRSGEQVTYNDLLHACLLRSGNDASNMLAIYSAGSVPKFLEGMNKYLKRMGLKKTHFENPHGLFMPNHQTTVYEMALLAKEALKHPVFKKVVKTASYPRPQPQKNDPKAWLQGNKLIRKGKHHYPKAIGVKTGYIAKSKHNIVAAAQQGNRRLIACVFGSVKRDDMFKEATRLFEQAFNERILSEIYFQKDQLPFKNKISGATSTLETFSKADIAYDYYPSEKEEVTCKLVWDKRPLPIKTGDKVGEVVLTSAQDKREIKRIEIYASNDVEKFSIMKYFIDLFQDPMKPLIVLAIFFLCATIAATVLSKKR